MIKIKNSLRAKITLLTVCVAVIAVTITTLLSVAAIKNIGSTSADRTLLLLCQTGSKNLDSYLQSVEQSVELVAGMAEDNLNSLSPNLLGNHMLRVQPIFERMAEKTNGVLTYYYRIDPTVSEKEPGFWYTNLDGTGFVEHQVTDITQYDTEDTSHLVWFTVPKVTGESVWLPPYITDNLDTRVISYNHPIYYQGERFIGVIGIEIDYNVVASQVRDISMERQGYAFLIDREGHIIYHPNIDVATLQDDALPSVPEVLLGEETYVDYRFDGVEKRAAWLPLANGMRLVVTVPYSEISETWRHVIREILAAAILLLVVVVLLTLRFTTTITRPLRRLTEAANRVNEGHYDLTLRYSGNDEVGLLTATFDKLIQHLKVHISDLNSLAYADALTQVRNKGAYDIYIRKLQEALRVNPAASAFAIAVFDCDGLKSINDRFGHDKGDLYLKTASHLICHVFLHCPVFRTGGDEFSVILQKEAFQSRELLALQFMEESADRTALAEHPWEEIRVSMGVAAYEPKTDRSVMDVARRADRLMYENKRKRKSER